MKTLLFTLLLFLAVGTATAQSGYSQKVSGTVTDALTGFPLPGATVVLLQADSTLGTATDANGNFTLANVPIGRRSFEISFMGYRKSTVANVQVESGKQLQLNIRLQEEAIQVNEVTVKATKPKDRTQNEMALVSARSFTVEETERFAGSLGDPARMVANYAGVMTQNDSRNDIIIRGNSPTGVLWRIEGIETGNPNHFGAMGTTGGPVSMINNNLLANSDFLTGAFPAEYGNALAGAFDLQLRSGNRNRFEGMGQIGFNGFELGLEGPIATVGNGQKASLLANYRYSTLELLDKVGFNLGTGASIPRYKDFTVVLDVPGTRWGRFKAFALWGNSDISFGRSLEQLEASSYNTRGTATDFGSKLFVTGLNHTLHITENTRWRSTASYQRAGAEAVVDSVRMPGLVFVPNYRATQFEDRINLSTQLLHKFSARDNISAGLLFTHIQANYIDSVYLNEEGSFRTLTDTDGALQQWRAHVQWQHHFSNRLNAVVGLQSQYLTQNASFALEPRIGLRYQATNRSSWNLGYGLHSQMQTIGVYQLQTWHPSTASYSRTNTDLGYSRSHHLVAGHDLRFSEHLRLKTEAYYQHLFQIPVTAAGNEAQHYSLINTGDSFGSQIEDSLVNQGRGRNFGLEITLERFLNRGYYFLFTASLFDSKYRNAAGEWRNTAFNGNYVLNLLGGYEWALGKKTFLTLDLKAVWAGGRRHVPIDLAASQQKGEAVYDWQRAYEPRYNDYLRSDLRIGLKLNARRYSQEWAIDLQNFTAYQSILAESYDANTREVYHVYQQGFVPMMLYRVRF